MLKLWFGIIGLILSFSTAANACENGPKYTMENCVKVYRGGQNAAQQALQSQQRQAIIKTNIAREALAVRKEEARAKARANQQAAYERGFAQGTRANNTRRVTRTQRRPVRYWNSYGRRYYNPYYTGSRRGHGHRRRHTNTSH